MNQTEQRRIFGEWLDRHRGLLFKVVHAYSFTPHDRDDLFQEIAAQLWTSIPSFQGDSKASTWIYRVALFAAITWVRRERRHRDGHEAPDASEPLVAPVGDPRVAWLYREIGRLDPIDRSLILLLLEGFSYQEMAGFLGISESNVGVRIHRIKRRLGNRVREA
jgi:RNA polymerase sigma-70 factor (ECF subfamily)